MNRLINILLLIVIPLYTWGILEDLNEFTNKFLVVCLAISHWGRVLQEIIEE